MTDKYNTRILYIHSRDRTSGTSDNFSIVLDQGIANVTKVKLISVSIPTSYYNITTNNNKINTNLGIITITPGHYNINELKSELLTQLSTIMTNPPTAINYNLKTMKLEFVMSTQSITFQFAGNSNQLYRELGFENSNYTLNASTTFIPPNVINLSFPNYCFIVSKELGSRTLTTDLDFVTFTVPLTQEREKTNVYFEKSHFQQVIKYDTFINIYNLSFKLITEGNQSLSLNGCDWSMLLEVTTYQN